VQVNRTIDIFEGKTNGLAQGLFLFDNTPSHLKHADDAISATKMVKSVLFFLNSFFSYQHPSRSQVSLDMPPEGATHALSPPRL